MCSSYASFLFYPSSTFCIIMDSINIQPMIQEVKNHDQNCKWLQIQHPLSPQHLIKVQEKYFVHTYYLVFSLKTLKNQFFKLLAFFQHFKTNETFSFFRAHLQHPSSFSKQFVSYNLNFKKYPKSIFKIYVIFQGLGMILVMKKNSINQKTYIKMFITSILRCLGKKTK